MTLGIPAESFPPERRVAATPEAAGTLVSLGFRVLVERGAGKPAGFDDAAYESAGAVIADRDAVWSSEVVVKVRPPDDEEAGRLRTGQTLISFIYPAQHTSLVESLRARGVDVVAMDQVPRTTRAQKVDALSSMANLTGYRAVVEAAHALPRPFAGQTTAAGRIPPARILIIGAGVAGLAAIGAARALGAVVRAFDTRPAVREQVASMGAEFLEVTVAEDGTGTGGYAKEMSPAFIAAEMALFAAQAREVDVIITTALVPGRRAPVLISREMVASMRHGSVIVDLAAEQGGNCEATVPGDAVDAGGVTVIGYTDLPSRLAPQASRLYATNVVNLIEEMGGAAAFALDEANDIVGPMTVVRDGRTVWPRPAPPSPAPGAVPAPGRGPAGGPQAAPADAPAATSASREPRKTPGRKGHGSHAHAAPVGPPSTASTWLTLLAGGALFAVGSAAPASLLTHLTVFVLACFVGYHVVWSVTPALHTPLMSVTNAISGIIVLGGLVQIGLGVDSAAGLLGLAAVFVAVINIAGGFLVTQRMLKMFRR
jgi:NAD(P) transhydrogenase subunit alpha